MALEERAPSRYPYCRAERKPGDSSLLLASEVVVLGIGSLAEEEGASRVLAAARAEASWRAGPLAARVCQEVGVGQAAPRG